MKKNSHSSNQAKPLAGVSLTFVPLGCAKNLVDSERMLAELLAAGVQLVEEPTEADVVLINTCGFIRAAQEESLQALEEALELKADGTIKGVVCAGCLSQRFSDELTEHLPGLDAVLGIDSAPDIVRAVLAATGDQPLVEIPALETLVEHCLPRELTTPPWFAYLKIGDGCDNWCSYCAIPIIRGRARSAPLDELVAEAKDLTSRGVKELNLIAQDLGRYGQDLPGAPSLATLVSRLLEETGPDLHWLRLLYLHPEHIQDDLLALMAEQPRLVRYLDVPFQHASGPVLARMNRKGDLQSQLALVQRLRDAVPGLVLRTTVLVGFPGETEADFEELMEFIEKGRFDRLTAFAYSPEEGTAAFDLPDRVPEELAQERLEAVFESQRLVSSELTSAFVGQKLEVLLESNPAPGQYVGRSYRDAPEVDCEVQVMGSEVAVGQFVRVHITGADDYDMRGEVI